MQHGKADFGLARRYGRSHAYVPTLDAPPHATPPTPRLWASSPVMRLHELDWQVQLCLERQRSLGTIKLAHRVDVKV